MFNKGYARYYDLFNQDKRYRKEIEFVFKWAEKPAKILDFGAGTAGYWKYYPKSAMVLGIEKSKDMINMSENKNDIIRMSVSEIRKLCKKCLILEQIKSNMKE